MKIRNIALIILTLISSTLYPSCSDTITIAVGDYDNQKDPISPPTQPIGDIVKISPLSNPDRGYHLESGYFAHNFVNPFNTSETYPDGFIDKREKMYGAMDDKVTLTQLYIYLTEWVDRDIPQSGLDNIQTIFDGLKSKGYKAILRFAYNWEGLNTSGGESERWIKRHIEQLKPILEKNTGLIATIQTGFIGAWGEWHSSPLANNQNAKNATVNALLDALPAPYCIEIRTPDHKNAFTLTNEDYRSRIGYANDYFTAGEHSHAPGNDFVPGSDWYKQVEKESPYFYMSGEIPYDENTEWGLAALINTNTTLTILRNHHYSAFDITQNYDLNIKSWKQVKVYPDLLKANKILFSEDYFKDEKGNTVARSYYEFVRDHLGYRLNLLNTSTIKNEGGNLIYDLKLTNTGFATVVNPKSVYLVLINANNKVEKEIKLDVNPKDWQPFDPVTKTYDVLTHSIKGSTATGLSGKYKVGIWMPDGHTSVKYNNIFDIKWALNDVVTHWSDSEGKYTINIIGEVTI